MILSFYQEIKAIFLENKIKIQNNLHNSDKNRYLWKIFKTKKMLSESVFVLHKTTRTTLRSYLENLSPEQLGKIPAGFNNNIFWNIAHCVATQQILCYKLSNLPMEISEDFLEKYRKGSRPEAFVPSAEEIQQVKKLLLSTQEKLQKDYYNGVFQNFTAYPTSYGFDLNTIEDAISFNNTHEAMHLGTIKALCYFV